MSERRDLPRDRMNSSRLLGSARFIPAGRQGVPLYYLGVRVASQAILNATQYCLRLMEPARAEVHNRLQRLVTRLSVHGQSFCRVIVTPRRA